VALKGDKREPEGNEIKRLLGLPNATMLGEPAELSRTRPAKAHLGAA